MSNEIDERDVEQIVAEVRRFVRNEVMPREQEIMETDAIPDDLKTMAAGIGLFGYALPQRWGGLGLDVSKEVELLLELSYTTLALRSMVGTNNGIAGQVLASFGTEEQQQQWLSALASGEATAAFALTEDGAGSNPRGLRTRAVRDGDDWLLIGEKRFITNAPVADLLVVFARVRPAERGRPGIAVFLVPAGAPGLTIGDKDVKMGQEGACTADVHLDNVRVPGEALVGADEDAGYRAAMASLTRGRIAIAAAGVGIAQRAHDESLRHAAIATQGGTPIGDFQLVQAMLADQFTDIAAARSLVRHSARQFDEGLDQSRVASSAKLFCTEVAGRVADSAVQIHGGLGYMRSTAVERIYRDVRLLRIYEGTSEIQKLIIGGDLLRSARQ